MTPEYHKARAEECLAHASERYLTDLGRAEYWVKVAQVHATLALSRPEESRPDEITVKKTNPWAGAPTTWEENR